MKPGVIAGIVCGGLFVLAVVVGANEPDAAAVKAHTPTLQPGKGFCGDGVTLTAIAPDGTHLWHDHCSDVYFSSRGTEHVQRRVPEAD